MPTPLPRTIIPLTELTTAELKGTGVFDTLMQATKVHLESEYQKGRIKGTEYATVYLGSLESTLRAALEFLLQRQRAALEAELLGQKILVAQAEVKKAEAAVRIAEKEVEKIGLEVEILTLNKEKIPAEIAVLRATKCKLDAEYDVLLGTSLKTTAETQLLNQKTVTERAQVSQTGVDDNSVIGKQKGLYQAQTDGFARDAEQKAAKIFADVWNVQRTTDEELAPPTAATNTQISAVLNQLRAGIGA